MKIVFLDRYTVANVDTSVFGLLGDYSEYDYTYPDQLIDRCKGADVVITNKVYFGEDEMKQLPDLRLICIAATGMNNVDLDAAKEHNIAVKNVVNYSTSSVAEHTFALLLELYKAIPHYDAYVKDGSYSKSGRFFYPGSVFHEIHGKKWGIIGMGNIGKKVAAIATAFGAEVVYYSTSGRNMDAGYPAIALDELMSTCDIITIHAPLNDATRNLIDLKALIMMKPTAYIINVGRGGIVDEAALATVLNDDTIAGAALDVYSEEPLSADSPLLKLNNPNKIVLTPHIAWASYEARNALVQKIVVNIKETFNV
ncbi:MAG: D-2-hydroxyacid dehydrogenase [Tannerellaceae bacterium]